MHIPQPIRRLAPVAAVATGLAALGVSAGGVASMDGALASAAAEQRQTRLVVDRAPGAPGTCPDRAPAAMPDRWRS